MKKYLFWTAVLIGIGGFPAGCFIRGMLSKGTDPHPETVHVETVASGDLIEFVHAPGNIAPRTTVAISSRVSSRILAIPLQEGDKASKGDPKADPPVPPSTLIQLDATDLDAALKAAQSRRRSSMTKIEVEKSRIQSEQYRLEGTRATLEQAKKDWLRKKSLFEANNASESDVEDAYKRYEELQSTCKAAEEDLKAARLQQLVLEQDLQTAEIEIARARDELQYTTITSPIDGVVTKIHAEVGELVMTGTMNNPGTVIMEVADLSTMLMVAEVHESDVGRVTAGQDAWIHVRAYPDAVFHGSVMSVALTPGTKKNGSKYYDTNILIEPNEHKLFAGLTADVDIAIKHHQDILKVPTQAILAHSTDDLPPETQKDIAFDRKKTLTTVVYRFMHAQAILTPVKPGPSDDTHTLIRAGLAKGDKIIVGPYKILETISHEQNVIENEPAASP